MRKKFETKKNERTINFSCNPGAKSVKSCYFLNQTESVKNRLYTMHSPFKACLGFMSFFLPIAPHFAPTNKWGRNTFLIHSTEKSREKSFPLSVSHVKRQLWGGNFSLHSLPHREIIINFIISLRCEM